MRVEGSGVEGRLTPLEISSLAAAVASEVGAVLPEGFSCVANDATVILVRGHLGIRGLDLADVPEWRADSWREDLAMVLWQVLSDFQDEIIEQLGQAWPPIPGASGIAVPHTRIDNGMVRAWYGTDDAVVVSLKPLGAQRPGQDPAPGAPQPA